jgi:hypothetical protein
MVRCSREIPIGVMWANLLVLKGPGHRYWSVRSSYRAIRDLTSSAITGMLCLYVPIVISLILLLLLLILLLLIECLLLSFNRKVVRHRPQSGSRFGSTFAGLMMEYFRVSG